MTTPTATPPKTRTVDPAIAALRKEHADKVARLKFEQQSAKVLKRIIGDIKDLTETDVALLAKAIRELQDGKQ